jgi:hypothetical protein
LNKNKSFDLAFRTINQSKPEVSDEARQSAQERLDRM